MKNLITPAEVIEIAFAANDQIDRSVITENRIEAAQLKFLAPRLRKMYDALTEGKYDSFNLTYIKPALAHFVRYAVFLNLSVHIGNKGTVRTKTIDATVATPAETGILRREAREAANALLERAIDYLRKNAGEFPEFCPEKCRRRRVRVNGGIVL